MKERVDIKFEVMELTYIEEISEEYKNRFQLPFVVALRDDICNVLSEEHANGEYTYTIGTFEDNKYISKFKVDNLVLDIESETVSCTIIIEGTENE